MSCESFNLCSASFTVWPHAKTFQFYVWCWSIHTFCASFLHLRIWPLWGSILTLSYWFTRFPAPSWKPSTTTDKFIATLLSWININKVDDQLVGHLLYLCQWCTVKHTQNLLIILFNISSRSFPTGTVGVAHIF